MAKKNQMFFIDEKVKNEFKALTATKGTNMSVVVEKMIKQYINHNKVKS